MIVKLNPTRTIVLLLTTLIIYVIYYKSGVTYERLTMMRASYIRRSQQTHISLKRLLKVLIRATHLGGDQVYLVHRAAHSAGGLHTRSKGRTREGANDPLTMGDLRSHQAMVNRISGTFPGLKVISEETAQASSTLMEMVMDTAPSINHPDADLLERGNSRRGLSEEEIKILNDLPDGILPDISSSMQDDPRSEESDGGNFNSDSIADLRELTVWVDPLDATQEYTENLLEYVTTMACAAKNGVPILGVIHFPFNGETYWSWAGYGMSPNLKRIESSLISERTGINLNSNNKIKASNKTRVLVSRSHAGQVGKLLPTDQFEVIPAGGAGYKSLHVLNGTADIYLHSSLIKKWDICAANAIFNSVGAPFRSLKSLESSNTNKKLDSKSSRVILGSDDIPYWADEPNDSLHEHGIIAARNDLTLEKTASIIASHIHQLQ